MISIAGRSRHTLLISCPKQGQYYVKANTTCRHSWDLQAVKYPSSVSGEVKVDADVYAYSSLHGSADFIGIHKEAGLAVLAPQIKASFTGMAHDNVCDNPEFHFGLKANVAVGMDLYLYEGSDAIDSSKVHLWQPLIPVFESCYGFRTQEAASVPPPNVESPDGSCGGTNGYLCPGSRYGDCCSKDGRCGATPLECGGGCQSIYGYCPSPTCYPLNPPLYGDDKKAIGYADRAFDDWLETNDRRQLVRYDCFVDDGLKYDYAIKSRDGSVVTLTTEDKKGINTGFTKLIKDCNAGGWINYPHLALRFVHSRSERLVTC